MGDSKSTSSDAWVWTLLSQLDAAGVLIDERWIEDTPRNWAVAGKTVATLKSSIDDYISGHSINAWVDKNIFLINLGANDVGGALDEATWKANYQYIIDAILAKWPYAKIYIAKPWRRGYATECNTLAGWIDNLITSNAITYPGQVFLGHDEQGWLEGGDNGATMTTDGIHYSTAGHAECASQWLTILGY